MAGPNDTKNDIISKAKSTARDIADDLPPRHKLPEGLQKIVNEAEKDESLYDELWDGTAPESTDSAIRYAAYTSRIRTALLSAQRYVAYTSDIGESFRPVAHPNWVRAAYGVSWAYLAGDVAHEGYKAYCANQRLRHPELALEAVKERWNDARRDLPPVEVRGQEGKKEEGALLVPGKVTPLEDYRTVMVQRAIFQGLASMGLPAFTIHSIVRYSGRALKDVKNVKLRTWGPIGLGLSAVPALPYIFDEPVEKAVEFVFHRGFEFFGGHQAVGDAPSTGREKELQVENIVGKEAVKQAKKDL